MKAPYLLELGRRMRRGSMLLALACVPATTATAAEDAPATNQVQFRTPLRSRGGVVRCGLFARDGWLKKPVGTATVRADIAAPICIFRGIPAGTYGASAFHDKNGNGKLDTNFMGVPVEDYCASNDARGFMGPPSFEDAKFTYRGGTQLFEARMR